MKKVFIGVAVAAPSLSLGILLLTLYANRKFEERGRMR